MEPTPQESAPARRAPVQATPGWDRAAGTIAWTEHVEAWVGYSRHHGTSQDAERIAERGGFGYGELVKFLGREPTTWERR